MKTFEVFILGSLAALPHQGQLTSIQAIKFDNDVILMDCGEGAQININKYKIPLSRIKVICISHLHGDHLFGLPGLLSSFQHHQRKQPLTIIGPMGIKKYLETIFELTGQYVSYPVEILEFHAVSKELVFQSEGFKVYIFPLDHRILTHGFIFEESFYERNINQETIAQYNISFENIKRIKQGFDLVLADGRVVKNQDLTLPLPDPRRYAYCSDTSYDEKIAGYVQGVNCLYHEATYLHELVDKARERKHSTAKEAAMIARKANVGQLIIGHFSSRYKDFEILLEEARLVFPQTSLGTEGSRFFVS